METLEKVWIGEIVCLRKKPIPSNVVVVKRTNEREFQNVNQQMLIFKNIKNVQVEMIINKNVINILFV